MAQNLNPMQLMMMLKQGQPLDRWPCNWLKTQTTPLFII